MVSKYPSKKALTLFTSLIFQKTTSFPAKYTIFTKSTKARRLFMSTVNTMVNDEATTVSTKKGPLIGLGMAALGRPGYINLNRETMGVGTASDRSVNHMKTLAEKVMQCVLDTANTESSTNTATPKAWFDCARSYGKSEEFVGSFLRSKSIEPSDVYVSSKWGYEYVADWNVSLEPGKPHEIKNHSVEMFLKQLEETKHHIGEYIDLYQIHSATFESGVLTNSDVHEALHQCRVDLGWDIGLSVSSPKQNETLLEAMELKVKNGQRLFDSVQCTYNLLEQKPANALMEAHNAGMDIIIKEGMANGRLWNHSALKKMCQTVQSLSDFTTSDSDDIITPDQLALGAILAQPFQPRVLSGAVTCAQFKSNYKALKVANLFKTKYPDLLQQLMQECVMESNEYWDQRSALKWN